MSKSVYVSVALGWLALGCQPSRIEQHQAGDAVTGSDTAGDPGPGDAGDANGGDQLADGGDQAGDSGGDGTGDGGGDSSGDGGGDSSGDAIGDSDVLPAQCAIWSSGVLAAVDEQVPGWSDRAYDVRLPSAYRCTTETPVVIVLHGGGGNKQSMQRITCHNGDLNDPSCMMGVAEQNGFIVVFANGSDPAWPPDVRTWNAGGTVRTDDTWTCVSGFACDNHIDDVAYFVDLIDELALRYRIDAKRIYATGSSNGAAMTHRLACLLPDRIAAIAPVGGGNEYSTTQPCTPGRAVPVVAFHGQADPCWYYDTSDYSNRPNCSGATDDAYAITSTMADWAARDGCAATAISVGLPDLDTTDGSTVNRISYTGCRDGADVVLYEVVNGGHTWPGGSSPFGLAFGNINNDISANAVMWAFFAAHPLP